MFPFCVENLLVKMSTEAKLSDEICNHFETSKPNRNVKKITGRLDMFFISISTMYLHK